MFFSAVEKRSRYEYSDDVYSFRTFRAVFVRELPGNPHRPGNSLARGREIGLSPFFHQWRMPEAVLRAQLKDEARGCLSTEHRFRANAQAHNRRQLVREIPLDELFASPLHGIIVQLNNQRGRHINEPTLRRIPLYHQILTDLDRKKQEYVSSKYLATFMRVDDAQVRKDLAIIGYRGKPKSGYSVSGLKNAVGEYLGINYKNTAILIGAGRLGSALAEYPGFEEYGLKLVAIFDGSAERVGKVIGDFTILSIDSLPRIIRNHKIGIAIITVPKEAAQTVCNTVVELGIKAIWNFAPTRLELPEDVVIRSENLAVGVAMLSHYLKVKKQELGK